MPTINGTQSDDTLYGTTQSDTVNGLGGDDIIFVDQGGDDVIDGGTGEDLVLFGAAFTAADRVQGGDGIDGILLTGDYSAGVTLAATSITNVEIIILDSGFNYRLITNDANVAAGQLLVVDATVLGAANSLYFDASAELDGNYTLRGGNGNDVLISGRGNDTIDAGVGDDQITVFGGGDSVTGGDGFDTLVIDYSTTAGSVQGSAAGSPGTGNFYDLMGRNVVYNGIERVFLTTGNLNDVLTLGSGEELVTLNGGDDFIDLGMGNATADGGTGIDGLTANLSHATGAIQWDLQANTFSGGTGNFTNFEYVYLLWTGSGDDVIVTSALDRDESIWTGAGNDTVTIVDGMDNFDGGAGFDTLIVDFSAASEAVLAWPPSADGNGFSGNYHYGMEVHLTYYGVERVIISTGSADDNFMTLDGDDVIHAGAGDDYVTAAAGNDRIDGGTGADIMFGGTGDDTYVVDNANDLTFEVGESEGFDLVESSISITLATFIENLTLTAAGAVNGTGNELANVIVGNAFANLIDGGAGADLMKGGDGNDTYVVDQAGDAIVELADGGTDTVRAATSYALGATLENLTLLGSGAIDGTGNALANILVGNSGNNRLDGGAGADQMQGGSGSDTYVVDDLGDVIVETAIAESDTVRSSVSYTLGDKLENLVLTGAAALNGTGNALANNLAGNSAANVLDGGAENDVLDGGAGADTMNGGVGSDTYVVDNIGDVVTELSGAGIDLVMSAISLTLGANVENLILSGAGALNGTGNGLDNNLYGNSAANALSGGAGLDTLSGDAGNDLLDGGTGNDSMTGGAGDDTYVVDNVGDFASESAFGGTDVVQSIVDFTLGTEVENLTLGGSSAINGTGNGSANVLTGNDAANRLDGRAGADTLSGGLGNDIYDVDHVGDLVIEAAGGGTDTVQSAITYTLGAELENLTLVGMAAIDGTGNALVNVIQGSVAANVIDGGAGADTMSGILGDDTYIVDNVGDVIIELAGNGNDTARSSVSYSLSDHVDNLVLTGISALDGTGNAQANQITGNSAANVLSGLGGNDTMSGGLGNDTYVVDAAGDVAIEGWSSGTDTVQASVSYTIGANVENILLTGTAAIDGTGNSEGNSLTGNSADNVLNGLGSNDVMSGGLGNDTYIVDATGDVVTELAGGGFDIVQATATFTLGANVENLTLTGAAQIDGIGNELANILIGNARNNYLHGAGGADTMTGGLGDDTYGVWDVGDVVIELAGGGTDNVQSSASYTLSANVENLTLTGGSVINGTGNTLDNILTGNIQANILNGAAGADHMVGGAGGDTYVVDNAGDTILEDHVGGIDLVQSSINFTLAVWVENLILTGAAAINGNGNTLDNVLTGNGAANILNGFTGADTMQGGLGNDTYVVDNLGDLVIETGAGIDTVQSSLSFTLGANVENLILTGIGTINGTGNALANALTGNGVANTLDGGAGGDTMTGGLGNDTYVFDSVSDKAIEAAGGGTDKVLSSIGITLGAEVENLTLTGAAAINGTGNALANTILGNSAANILNGGAGDDSMTGGAGDDLYVVDSIGDKAIEAAGGGVDRVQSSVTFILGAEVENLTLTGAAAINGTGNALANMLTGNAAANVLDGKAGADIMQGGAGDDTYVVDDPGDLVSDSSATGGIDLVKSAVSFTLGVNLENLTLTGTAAINATGNGLDNIIVGNAGANLIDGKGGADTMTGGAGDDTYFIDNAGDVAIETNAAHGNDTVRSGLSYTLGANIENLVLTGPGAIDGTGSSANNILTGNGAANVLSGLLGNDTLLGGGGADTLKGATGNDIMEGGTGADSFIFDSALNATTNLDHIVDFAHLADKLVLENARFSGLAAGALSASAFVVGTAAADASDRIIYDAATGALYFDSDGTGAAAQVQFATLDNMPVNLSASDFLII